MWFGASDEEEEEEDNGGWDWDYTEWMPEWNHTYRFLHFSGTESVYRSDDSATAAFNEQAYAKVKEAWGDYYWEEPDERIYLNTETNEFIQNKDLMGKEFLIVDTISTPTWKLTGEQATILDYVCMKATTTVDSTEYEAWFTMQIPVSHGPYGLSGLPGMILKISTNDGNFIIVAHEITLNPPDEELVEAPDKGKKVTKEEYEETAKAKYKEMQEQYGGDYYWYGGK